MKDDATKCEGLIGYIAEEIKQINVEVAAAENRRD